MEQHVFLNTICRCIDAEHSFNFRDWEILFYTLENYHPDFIFELGRGEGNSTAVISEHCKRHSEVSFLSVDLYNTFGQEVLNRLPSNITDMFTRHDLRHIDFLNFDIGDVVGRDWKRLFLFWDVNDESVAKRMVREFLPYLQERQVLICMHDVSMKTGRPRRYHWREYESMYPDIAHVGEFIDQNQWAFGVPDTRKIFGKYENAGHMLLFSTIRKPLSE